jgi:hypothetical protein
VYSLVRRLTKNRAEQRDAPAQFASEPDEVKPISAYYRSRSVLSQKLGGKVARRRREATS